MAEPEPLTEHAHPVVVPRWLVALCRWFATLGGLVLDCVEGAVTLAVAGGGSATVRTVEGGTLTARVTNGRVVLTDAKGGTSMVTISNVNQSNGVIHVVDTVLMPPTM